MDITKVRALIAELTNAVTESGRIVRCDTADSLQQKINDALPGDVIELIAGQRYVVGMLHLPPKDGLVTIRTEGSLPDGTIQPTDRLAILASGNPDRTIDGIGACNYLLDGLEFESSTDGHSDIIRLNDANNVTFNRVKIVAGPLGQVRAIAGHGRNITLTNSHIANIFHAGQDSQCFFACEGCGPYTITDNYLEAAGENILFGGDTTSRPGRVPSQILIQHNDIVKRDEWRTQRLGIKNLIELKIGRGVVIRENYLRGCWIDAQDGWAVVLKSVDQYGLSPWATLEDVTLEHNDIGETLNGINIAGYDWERPSGRTTHINILNNFITVDNDALQAGGEIRRVMIDGNTITQGRNLMNLYSGGVALGNNLMRDAQYAIEDLTFTNNKSMDVPYGIKGDGSASGEPSLKTYCKTYTYSNNTYV